MGLGPVAWGPGSRQRQWIALALGRSNPPSSHEHAVDLQPRPSRSAAGSCLVTNVVDSYNSRPCRFRFPGRPSRFREHTTHQGGGPRCRGVGTACAPSRLPARFTLQGGRDRRPESRTRRAGGDRLRDPGHRARSHRGRRARRCRHGRRVYAECNTLRPEHGRARGREACAVREAGRVRLSRDAARRRDRPIEETEDEAWVHVPVQSGDAVHEGTDRRGIHRSSIHIQWV